MVIIITLVNSYYDGDDCLTSYKFESSNIDEFVKYWNTVIVNIYGEKVHFTEITKLIY